MNNAKSNPSLLNMLDEMDGELFFRYEMSEPARSDRLCQYFLSSQINSLDTCAMPALRRASRRWRGGEIHPALARILAHRNVCGCCWEWGRRDDTAKFCKSVFAQKLFLMSFGGARISHQRREGDFVDGLMPPSTDRPTESRKMGPFSMRMMSPPTLRRSEQGGA